MPKAQKSIPQPQSKRPSADPLKTAGLEDSWLEIGRIVSTQGLKGELRVYPTSDFPERFEEPGQRWLLYPGETEPREVELVSGRYLNGKGLYILKLAGITNVEQAEALRDCRLVVPVGDRPTLEAGEYHILDLVGLKVFDQATQSFIGTVISVLSAGNDLLEVERPQPDAASTEPEVTTQPAKPPAPVLIPFVEAIVPVVDLEQGRIEITPPAGLID